MQLFLARFLWKQTVFVVSRGNPVAWPQVMSFPGGSLTWLQRSIWRALWHVGRSSLHAWLADADASERHRTAG